MHEAFDQFTSTQLLEANFVSEDAISAAAAVTDANQHKAHYQPSSYRPPQLGGWTLGLVALAHAGLLSVIATLQFAPAELPRQSSLVVMTLTPPDPQSPAVMPPAPDPAPVKMVEPPVIAPKPLVTLPPPPSPVATSPVPLPPKAVLVEAVAAPSQPPSPPVAAPDLASSVIFSPKPSYPLESNRRREEGVVVLSVVVGTSGLVEQISVSKSSGYSRLDKAALGAVRRWRWSPTVYNGHPVKVRGTVPVPFELKKAAA